MSFSMLEKNGGRDTVLIKLLLSAEKMTRSYISLTNCLGTNVNAFFMYVYSYLLSHFFF